MRQCCINWQVICIKSSVTRLVRDIDREWKIYAFSNEGESVSVTWVALRERESK